MENHKLLASTACALILFLLASVASPHEVTIHQNLTRRTFEYVVSQDERLAGLPETVRSDLEAALVDAVEREDDIFGIDVGINRPLGRFLFHFLPHLDQSVVFASCSSMEWAFRDTATPEKQCSASVLGLGVTESNSFSWQNALDAGATREGFQRLGHVLHLLQDLTSPAHVRNDPHPPHPDSIGQQDIYEKTIGSLAGDAIGCAGSGSCVPGLPLMSETSPESLFEQLRAITASSFYSKDTVDDVDITAGGTACGAVTSLDVLDFDSSRCGPASVARVKGYFYDARGRRIAKALYIPVFPLGAYLPQIDAEVAQDQFAELAPLTVRFGGSLIKLFLDKTLTNLEQIGGHYTGTWNSTVLGGNGVLELSINQYLGELAGRIAMPDLASSALNFIGSIVSTKTGNNITITARDKRGRTIKLTALLSADSAISGNYTVSVPLGLFLPSLIIDNGTWTASQNSPVANAGGPYSAKVGAAIQFDGSGSTGADLAFEWSFGDGASSTEPKPLHSYAIEGGYTVKLKVCSGNVCSTAQSDVVIINLPGAELTLGPTTLDFGSVIVGTCATGSFAIQHVLGTAAANGSVSTPSGSVFSVMSGATFDLSGSYADTVQVQFCPAAVGPISAVATITSSATFTGGNNLVSLAGVGVAKALFSLTFVDVPDTLGTSLVGVNNLGQAIGAADFADGSSAFVRSAEGSIRLLPRGTAAAAINDAGQVAGSLFDGEYHGFLRLADGTIVLFDPPTSSGTFPTAMNDLGQVVGYYTDKTTSQVGGFLRLPGGQIISVGPDGALIVQATGIDNAGAIVGHFYDGAIWHGFLRSPDGTYATIDPPDSRHTLLAAINSRGQIIGTYDDAQHVSRGFVRAADGTFAAFEPAHPMAINGFGQIIGGVELSDQHGFVRDSDGTLRSLNVDGARSTSPRGVNNLSMIVGTFSEAKSGGGFISRGFIAQQPRSAIVPTPFDIAGGIQTEAVGINDSGQITGLYVSTDTTAHGFVRTSEGVTTTIDVAGSNGTVPAAMNNGGRVVGRYSVFGIGGFGFLREADGVVMTLEVPESLFGTIDPTAINSSGQVVGTYSRQDRIHGFVRASDGTVTTIDVPEAIHVTDLSINDVGEIVARILRSDGTKDGVLRSPNGGLAKIAVPDAVETVPRAINVSGHIGGFFIDSTGISHGFLRAPDGTVRSFDPPGSVNAYPTAINNSNQIVGVFDDGSRLRGFLRWADGTFTMVDPPGSETGSGHIQHITINNAGSIAGSFFDGTKLRYRAFSTQ